MDIEKLFENAPQAEAPTPEPEPVIEPTPEVAEPVAPEPTPDPVAAPEAQDEARHVPLATFLDKRDEAKELKRRVAELEAQTAPKPAPVDMPDPIDDPHGFANWQQGQVQQALVAQRFEISDLMAKQTHGEEAVKTAAEWAMERAQSDPSFKMAYMQQPHPLDWIVREHKRSGLISEIGDNVDDWFTREAAKRGYAQAAPAAAAAPVAATPQPAVKPAVPPRSIASDATAPQAARDATTDFMAAFKR